MKKVLLIKPKNDVVAQEIPLGLLHIGTVLNKEGYAVTIIDAAKQPGYEELISKEIDDTLIVGITCLTSEVASAIEISDYIKSISNVPVIWGGWHPTLFPEQVCCDKSVDFACVGEGEYTILELVKALEADASFANIGGLAYKDNGSVKVNPQKGYVNLEELPPIDYGLIDISRYIRTLSNGERRIPYQSSRGCPHRCKFCINVVTGNQIYRVKSPEKVVNEIQILIDKFGVNYIVLVEDNFFVNITRSRGILEEIIKSNLNIKWFAECRVDYFKPDMVNESILDLAQRSGADEFTIGAESGSQRVLDLIDKGITVEQILTSAKILSGFNITAGYSFMLGIPGETREEMVATIKLAQKIYKLCPKGQIGFSIFTPYPKCELSEILVEKGLFKQPETLREWTSDEVRELYYGRFRSKPWYEDYKFMDNVIHYDRMAYNIYPYSGTKNWLRNIIKHPRKYRGMFLVLMAQMRMKHFFFAVPIDRILFRVYIYLRNRWRLFFR